MPSFSGDCSPGTEVSFFIKAILFFVTTSLGMVWKNHLGKPGFTEISIGENGMEILTCSPEHQRLLDVWLPALSAQIWNMNLHLITSRDDMQLCTFHALSTWISISDPQRFPVRTAFLPHYRWRNRPEKLTDLRPKPFFHALHRSVRLRLTLGPKTAHPHHSRPHR